MNKPNFNFIFKIFLFFSLSIGIQNVYAQRDSTKQIIIENADKHIIDNTTNPPTKYFRGNVRAYHKGSFFYCDSAVVIENTMQAYGDVTIVQHDTISAFSNEMFYDGDSLYSFLKGKVVLRNKKDDLYTEYLEYDMRNKKAYYRDKALLKSEKTEIKSLVGEYFLNENMVNFYQRVTVKGEDFYMVTDTLSYNTTAKVSTWSSPALINQDSAVIFSQKGDYSTNDKKANFIGKAQYKKNDVVANGNIIRYDGSNKSVFLYGDSLKQATYISATDTASADSIQYFESTEDVDLVGKATFNNKSNRAKGEKLKYNKKDEAIDIIGKGTIQDSTTILDAEKVKYNKATKLGYAYGNVIWQDTLNKTTLKTDSLNIDGNRDFFSATNQKDGKRGKPLLQSLLDQDTLYLSSNLIFREKIITKLDSLVNDTTTYMKAFGVVEILTKDMQAISDSMIFNQKDSVFLLFSNPFLWVDSTQLSADTIKIHFENKKVKLLELIDNGLLITSPDLYYFNQIGGNSITATFQDKQIDMLLSSGNAECIYYMLDNDNAYLGVSENKSEKMTFIFKEKKVDNIRFYKEPKSVISPMDKVDHEKIKLKGFEWNLSKRPMTLEDLFN